MRAIGNVEILNHCTAEEFLYLINSASHIICRSGYSSVMDMIVTCKNAILIPTPGQPEQEYLAIHLNGKYGFTCMSQNDFASANIEEITNCRSEALFYDKEALKKVLDLHL
jgi:predicted glycosyltransferase